MVDWKQYFARIRAFCNTIGGGEVRKLSEIPDAFEKLAEWCMDVREYVLVTQKVQEKVTEHVEKF